jgi:hypothetical protein
MPLPAKGAWEEEGEIVSRPDQTAQDLERFAQQTPLRIPASIPPLETTAFCEIHKQDIKFYEQVARADELAVALHSTRDQRGNLEFEPRYQDAAMVARTAGLAVAALTTSTVSLAKVMGLTCDAATAAELQEVGERLM